MAQEQKKPRGFANKTQDYSPPTAATMAVSAEETIARMEAVGKVKVIHGSEDEVFENLVGHKVQTVRASLVDAFNIPADALSFVNGEQVDGNYVLQKNDTLEFVKQAGVKG